jgi:uncharacterized protein
MPIVPSRDLRVVLDTNVYISAFTRSRGPSFQTWIAARNRHYHLLISPPIIREITGVLRREKFHTQEQDIADLVKLIAKVAEIVLPTLTLEVVREDPPDNRILECAVEGRANLIVSGNTHLKRLRNFEGIAIVPPRMFLYTLGVTKKKE